MEPRTSDAQALQRALADLLEAKKGYIETYNAWAGAPERDAPERVLALDEAGRRMDEARRHAALLRHE